MAASQQGLHEEPAELPLRVRRILEDAAEADGGRPNEAQAHHRRISGWTTRPVSGSFASLAYMAMTHG